MASAQFAPCTSKTRLTCGSWPRLTDHVRVATGLTDNAITTRKAAVENKNGFRDAKFLRAVEKK